MVSWNGLPVPVHSCVSRAVHSVQPCHSRAILDSGCIVTDMQYFCTKPEMDVCIAGLIAGLSNQSFFVLHKLVSHRPYVIEYWIASSGTESCV